LSRRRLEVEPRREAAAAPGEDHAAHAAVGGCVVERVDDPLVQLVGEAVLRLGTIERNEADSGLLDDLQLVAHASPPRGSLPEASARTPKATYCRPEMVVRSAQWITSAPTNGRSAGVLSML